MSNIESEIKIKILEVTYKGTKPISLSYELVDTSDNVRPMKLFYGQIKLDKTQIYTGMFRRWHKLSYNEESGEYQFPDPNDPNKPYRIYREVIDLVDNFVTDLYLTGRK